MIRQSQKIDLPVMEQNLVPDLKPMMIQLSEKETSYRYMLSRI